MHLPIAPVLVPLIFAVTLILAGRSDIRWQRGLGLLGTLLTLFVAILLAAEVRHGQVLIYSLGNWQPPFGILLVADRLAATMLVLTGLVAVPALLYASAATDSAGRYFHALFQFQLVGVNGAFLTGDIFNLFVFFEILLIASYTLLLHGGQQERVRMSMHFVLLNLVGSSLFLLGVGILYAQTGTLNMAHMAVKISALTGSDAHLVQTAGFILLVVFGLKAALLPLGFWLPQVYGAAAASVAALFAIMTKVGVYAILRVHHMLFGQAGGESANLSWNTVGFCAMATILVSAWGALSAKKLATALGYLVLASVGSILTVASAATATATAAALYYMLHSTLAMALLYLTADLLRLAGSKEQLSATSRPRNWAALACIFGFAAVAVASLPPLAGFLGKLSMLTATATHPNVFFIWTAILVGSLLTLIAVARTFSAIFWRQDQRVVTSEADIQFGPWRWGAVIWCMSLLTLLSLAAGPVYEYLGAAAAQTIDPSAAILAILGE